MAQKQTPKIVIVFAAAMAAAAFVGNSTARAQNADTPKSAPPRPFSLTGLQQSKIIFAEVWEGKVTEVVSGNLLRIERPNRNKGEENKTESVLVRLWGITLPADPETASAAKAYIEKSVGGKSVRVQVESRSQNGEALAEVFALPDKPRYGVAQGRIRNTNDPNSLMQPRMLSGPDIPANFPNLNEGLIRAGLGRWDSKAAAEASHLSGAQASAQKDKVGLWADADEKSGAASSAEKAADAPRRP